MERVLAAAEQNAVNVAVLKPGESVLPPHFPPMVRWWPDLPWRDGKADPILSSSVDHLMD